MADEPRKPGTKRPRTVPRTEKRLTARVMTAGLAASMLVVGSALPAMSSQGAENDKSPDGQSPPVAARSAQIIQVDGLEFRDLDGSGDLTPYEDWRLSPAKRAEDLAGRLNLAQKAGQLMHASLTGNGTYDRQSFQSLLSGGFITTYISRLSVDAGKLAQEHNDLQAMAEEQPFGIPLKISTDPRNGFSVTAGQTVASADFTPFPDPIGMGAVGDPAATKKMADIVREEYRAVGIHEALSPQADIATEPRWTRINGTFGSTGEEAKKQVKAYVEGLQGGTAGLTPDSVATVVKHWVGYGAQVNGYDSHYYYGRYAAFPGNNFQEHLTPYEGAFAAGAAGIMPTYSILKDLERDGSVIEQVGAGHNEYLLQDLLRGQYGFKGVITSDWGIANNCPASCQELQPPAPFWGPHGVGMPWGVEDMTLPERYASAVNAGVDIIGGSDQPQYIVQAVEQGLLSEDRLNEAVVRVLGQKFELGLFENPYVDPAKADRVVGSPSSRAVALDIQARSLTLLKNDASALPLRKSTGKKAFLYGVDAAAATAAGLVPVTDVATADVAIIRLTDPRGGDDLTDLNFSGDEADYQALVAAAKTGVKTIAVPGLTRPLILDNVKEHADAVLANYGVSDKALLDTIMGRAKPEGRLPFELPSSMDEVRAQLPDVPNDTANPLFDYGFGLSYYKNS
ncbi:beta-glucosidase [Arthrobacter sp. SLBN-100]|nr:beta-glucosidase [Arthrobacter sp. SLBN-100]